MPDVFTVRTAWAVWSVLTTSLDGLVRIYADQQSDIACAAQWNTTGEKDAATRYWTSPVQLLDIAHPDLSLLGSLLRACTTKMQWTLRAVPSGEQGVNWFTFELHAEWVSGIWLGYGTSEVAAILVALEPLEPLERHIDAQRNLWACKQELQGILPTVDSFLSDIRACRLTSSTANTPPTAI